MEFADLALGERDDADAGEAQLLEEGGDMFLVAADPVERLGHDDVAGTGADGLQQVLVAGRRWLAPERPLSWNVPTRVQPSRVIRSLQMAICSSVEAADCRSEE
jgi:hypothetical protein